MMDTTTSTTYRWVNQGEGRYLLRTRTVLANIGPAHQVVLSERTSVAYESQADYAEGVAWADEVAGEDYAVSMGA